ncbi:MAG TPA: type 1 glutamine amidotransferase [Patescibacteria group bacterium]|nr:type 1 glutamine amidotransferase [Patescibacteria group bacterium]
MNKLNIPAADNPYIEALRDLIRTGVTAAPNLEHSPLIDLPIVRQQAGEDASPIKRVHAFIEILRNIIGQRLEDKEAQTAAILFGLENYAGVPIQDRYRAVAKLYNPHWTWESYRKEPLTRHLLAVYLALKREAELSDQPSVPQGRTQPKESGTASKVLIVQNITREGPGLLERLLHEVAVDYDIIDLHKGEAFPDPTPYGALVVLGGPDSANDQTPKMITELERVKAALDIGVPYLGICLGLQVAVKVAGGKVVQGVKEIGLSSPEGTPYSVALTDLALTALGKKDPLFLGLRNDFRVFQLHGETVEMTQSMQLLAIGADCRNQIVKIRRGAYGIQSHFELTREMLKEWIAADPDLQPLGEQKIMAEFDALEEVYTITGLSLLRNFLHIAGLIT